MSIMKKIVVIMIAGMAFMRIKQCGRASAVRA